jgi:hypothetical protein
VQTEPHFEHPTAVWAVTGAIVGAVSVLALSVAAILLSGSAMELMAVAGLGAGFGGTGFGAMLGAVLASVRKPGVQLVSVREPDAEVRRRAMPS